MTWLARELASWLALSCAVALPATTFADPLPVRDQNPLLAGFALPTAHSPNVGENVTPDSPWTLDTTLYWGSSAIVQRVGDESLTVDAETREVRIGVTRSLPHSFALRVELPWRETTGGSLDGFIDDWHDTFGLPDGARSSLPRDRLHMFYRRRGVTQLDTARSSQGIGDMQIEIGKQLVSTNASHVAGWFGIKLPTGDGADFTGSGSVDVSGSVAGEHRFGSRYALFGQVGAAWLGEGERFEGLQRDLVWSAIAGVSARLWQPLTLIAQFDAHSAVYEDTSVDFLDDAGILTVGGTICFSESFLISLSVSEDIVVESSPDVVFNVGLNATF